MSGRPACCAGVTVNGWQRTHSTCCLRAGDSPGGWGAGVVTAIAGNGTTVTIPSGLATYGEPNAGVGGTAAVIAGPGAGQHRAVIGRPDNVTLQLAAPFDDRLVLGASIVALTPTIGGKIVADNHFTWGSVVQFFGTTYTSIFADNVLDHQDNAGADSGAIDGSMVSGGRCGGVCFVWRRQCSAVAATSAVASAPPPSADGLRAVLRRRAAAAVLHRVRRQHAGVQQRHLPARRPQRGLQRHLPGPLHPVGSHQG